MNRRAFIVSTLASAVCLPRAVNLLAQAGSAPVDLATVEEGKGLTILNKRTASRVTDGARRGIGFSAVEGEGPAYLDGVTLANGAIEVDIRGKDVQGQSFVGVAFHGVDGTTYDAIYFRPFNFRTEDAARRLRAVQYISHPAHPWQKLRAESPGKYEKPVNPVPDPNGWFRARIVIASPKVSVFVDGAKEPCLVIDQLSDRKTGRVGLWLGNMSGGDFANLRVTPA